MENFVVSARKYRPQTFDSVVGQDSITRTLLKAVAQNQLAQAFLFCGPRGVGKTTCARILARTVNAHAEGKPDSQDDYAFNIFELDAASNNSVDDIRSLIDQVRVPPQVGKYKVYIIDEVHMLSTAAFNAFLKTLEEPPAYAIFILATTEKHKVLPTIISRCQVFDFHRIQISEMVTHLQAIAVREGVEAESDALHIIAEKADGALRDALSIFDQMVSFSGKKMTYQDVIDNLNVLDYDYYFNLVDYFLAGDRASALVTLNNILNQGFDGHNFVNGLANHFRNLLFSVDASTTAILEVGENIREKYLQQCAACDVRFLLNAINLLSETDSTYKSSRNQRLLVELTLLKLCNIGSSGVEKKNDDSFANHVARSVEPPKAAQLQAPKPIAAPVQVAPVQVAREIEPSVQSEAPAKNDFSESNEAPSQIAEPAPTLSEQASAKVHEVQEPQMPAAESKTEIADELLAEESAEAIEPKAAEVPKSTSPSTDSGNTGTQEQGKLFSSKLANRRSKVVPSVHASHVGGNSNTTADTKNQGHPDDMVSPLTGERPATPFNLAMLWKVWDAYAAEIREQDRQSYYSTLTKRKPVVREENKIELIIDNHVQLADLDADKTNLLTHLREALNNWHIQLEGVIEEDDSNDDAHLYTPEERFKAMVEINPALGLLKRQFDLDIEHD